MIPIDPLSGRTQSRIVVLTETAEEALNQIGERLTADTPVDRSSRVSESPERPIAAAIIVFDSTTVCHYSDNDAKPSRWTKRVGTRRSAARTTQQAPMSDVGAVPG